MKLRIIRKLHKLACDYDYNEKCLTIRNDGYHILTGKLTKKQEYLLSKKHRREYMRFLCKSILKIRFDCTKNRKAAKSETAEIKKKVVEVD